MVTAIELLRQGKNEELWQMCCGFLKLNTQQFMEVQERLLMQQLEMLNHSSFHSRIMKGAKPRSLAEFRRLVPLTSYKDYCPEFVEKMEDVLPVKPAFWAHSAGRSGEYPCKWVPVSQEYATELSKVLYGIGVISGSNHWGDMHNIPKKINILYAVAPRPYISGTFADLLRMQSPINYLPPLEEAQNMSFEDRIKLGVKQALSGGMDYFFGLSLVLVNVGEKIRDSSNAMNLLPYMTSPASLYRLLRGKIRAKMAHRPMLPRDIWNVRGVMGSGTDSFVYKQKIKELWGKAPLDLYACTEGSVIATQAWDYGGMTFIPNLNFLEFIPEDENLKWQMDRSYQPRTLLLDEVKAGEDYEIVITSFHGGSLVRYRVGDMVHIVSLRNAAVGVESPQMNFERRVDDFLDFYVVNFTERSIWQAIEASGVAYEDWIAYKDAENLTLNIGLELKKGFSGDSQRVAAAIYNNLTRPDTNKALEVTRENDLTDVSDFNVKVDILPNGTFARFIAKRRSEGADLAHLKPPHVNPPSKVLTMLVADKEATLTVTKQGVTVEAKQGAQKVLVG